MARSGAYAPGGNVKRYFDLKVPSGHLWEYDTGTRHARWVRSEDGMFASRSHLLFRAAVNDTGTSQEVFPDWADPALQLPEGM